MEFTFNGISSTVHSLLVTKVERGVLPPRAAQMLTAPGKAGAHFFRTERGIRTFNVSVDLIGELTLEDYEERMRLIAEWLDVDEPKPLIFDREPDKTYYAIPDGDWRPAQAGTYGSFTITFLCPDPYAYGETKSASVAQGYPVFSRGGAIRYRDDGTQVTADYPYYKTGKYGKAILVEEGTTNLLPSASAPATETLTVLQGSDYYLTTSGTGASAKIEHKRVENIATANQTLSKSGTDFSKTDTSIADFTATNPGGANTNVTTGTDGNNNDYLKLSNTINWTFKDGLDNYTTNWTALNGTVTQNGDSTVTVTSSATVQAGLDRQGVVNFTNGFTLEFRAIGDGIGTFYVSNGTILYTGTIPNTSGAWAWFRLTIPSGGGAATLYQDGTPVTTITSQSYATNRILLGYYGAGTAGRTTKIDAVYYSASNLGAPPTNGIYTGNRVSPEFDVSSAGTALAFTVSYTYTNTLFYVNEQGTTTVEVRKVDYSGGPPVYSSWVTVPSSGSTMSSVIAKGESLANKKIQYRVTFTSKNSADSPWLWDITLNVTSGYNSSQTFTLPAINVSDIGTTAGSNIDWTATTGASTSVTVETSLDGSTWTPATKNTSFITNGTNLAGKSLYVRYTLSTTDVAQTPTLSSITWQVAQQEPNKIKPVTTTLILTPTNVTRWQLENKTFPTGWHAYGSTRKDEELSFVASRLNAAQGTIELWAYWDGNVYVRDRYLLDSDGTTGRFSLYVNTSGQWIVRANGATQITWTPSPALTVGWHHVAVRWNGTRLDLLVDGVQKATVTMGSAMSFSGVTKVYLASGKDRGDVTNLVPYPAMNTDSNGDKIVDGFNYVSDTNVTVTYDLDSIEQAQKFAVTASTAGPRFPGIQTDYINVTPGKTYAFSCAFKTANATGTNTGARLEINWYRTDNSFISNVVSSASTSSTWSRLRITGTAPTDAVKARLKLTNRINAAGDTLTAWYRDARFRLESTTWNGLIDDVRVSKIYRSDSEILATANSGTAVARDDNTTLKLALDDSLAPDVTVNISNNGTAETYPIFTATMNTTTNYFKIRREDTGEYVYVPQSLVAGDVITINNEKARVEVNGNRVAASLDSDFFSLAKGAPSITIDPVGSADVTLTFTERWK